MSTVQAYDYSTALKSRLNQIDQVGADQTTWEKIQQQQRQSREAAAQRLTDQQAANNSALIGQDNQNYLANSGDANSSSFDRFKNAIGEQESGGNYGARNASGAMGKYQIMPANISGTNSGWDYEALGHDVSTAQYMASPQIQEQIASYKLKGYFDRYGPAGAAVAWYAGPASADRYSKSGRASTAGEGGYPSQSSYVQQILKRAGL